MTATTRTAVLPQLAPAGTPDAGARTAVLRTRVLARCRLVLEPG
ncbi:hypothetical protein [Nocardioides lentus]